jgi:hypothetical protein
MLCLDPGGLAGAALGVCGKLDLGLVLWVSGPRGYKLCSPLPAWTRAQPPACANMQMHLGFLGACVWTMLLAVAIC